MRPPENTDHSRAFAIIFGAMLAITLAWSLWVVSAQLNELADPVRELVVPT